MSTSHVEIHVHVVDSFTLVAGRTLRLIEFLSWYRQRRGAA